MCRGLERHLGSREGEVGKEVQGVPGLAQPHCSSQHAALHQQLHCDVVGRWRQGGAKACMTLQHYEIWRYCQSTSRVQANVVKTLRVCSHMVAHTRDVWCMPFKVTWVGEAPFGGRGGGGIGGSCRLRWTGVDMPVFMLLLEAFCSHTRCIVAPPPPFPVLQLGCPIPWMPGRSQMPISLPTQCSRLRVFGRTWELFLQ